LGWIVGKTVKLRKSIKENTFAHAEENQRPGGGKRNQRPFNFMHP